MFAISHIAPIFALNFEEIKTILEGLPLLYEATSMSSFPLASIRLINELIPKTLFSSYNEVEVRTGSARVFCEPPNYIESCEKHKPAFWKYRDQHPIMALYQKGEHEGVRMISDFLSTTELHQLELHSEVLAPMGIEDTLSFTLPCTSELKVFYAINSPEHFDERDRAIVKLLQPHFIQAFKNAVTITNTGALEIFSTHTFKTENHGLLLADFSGRIIHASEKASSHLPLLRPINERLEMPYACNETLPNNLMNWLQGGKSVLQNPFETEIIDGMNLIVRASIVNESNWIIETYEHSLRAESIHLQNTYQLSERQADVLLWLSRGKSNADIGRILNISDRTVAKHIEHIFAKLGVENRLSATRKAVEMLGF